MSENTLKWGENISPENMDKLRQGEMFVLLDDSDQPYSEIVMDYYGQIRERMIAATTK